MRIPVTVELTDREPFTVNIGFKAQGAAEERYNFALSKAAESGIRQEWWAYMAWTQAVHDQTFLGPFTAFWDTLDDMTVGGQGEDPTGPGQEA